MSRLIDAEHFRKRYCDMCQDLFACQGEERCIFLEMFKNEPTAYDVDAVMKELSDNCMNVIADINGIKTNITAVEYGTLIDVIQKGGENATN